MKKVAIIGFGRAGHSAAETLRKKGFDGTISVFTDSVTGVENPMLTTYYASEKIAEQAVMPFGNLEKVQNELHLDLRQGVQVSKIFPDVRTVVYQSDGEEKREVFDDIVIATGSAPILPDFQAKDPARVITIRNIGDARRMNYALYHAQKVLVVGCSMIGIKVVQALTEHEADITFIDFADKVFPTAVLPGSEEILAKKITEKGIKLKLSTGINGISEMPDGDGTVKLEAEFTDGTKELFDTAFLCMGTRARIDVVKDTGITTGRAIVVDDHMRTNLPHIYAAGDCCEAFEISTGHSMNVALWANAAEQGKIAAENIMGGDASYGGNLICNITHFWDTDFVSIGNNRAEGELITYSGTRDFGAKDWYFSAVLADGKLACVNIIDHPELSGTMKRWMEDCYKGRANCKELAIYNFERLFLPPDLIRTIEACC